MPIYYQGKKIKELYFGGKKIKEAWYGGSKVYGAEAAAWADGTWYEVGDIVLSAGEKYECIRNNLSNYESRPPYGNRYRSFWKEVETA